MLRILPYQEGNCTNIRLRALRDRFEIRAQKNRQLQPKPLADAPSSFTLPPITHALPPLQIAFSDAAKTQAADILDAAAEIINRHKKGQGRAADILTKRLQISPSTIYQARSLLRHGGAELIERVRTGELTIKAAYKSISRPEAG